MRLFLCFSVARQSYCVTVPHASAGRLLVRAIVLGKRLADNPRSTLEDIAAHFGLLAP
jgi:hypothetical protein